MDQSSSEWVRVGQSSSEWVRVNQSDRAWFSTAQNRMVSRSLIDSHKIHLPGVWSDYL